MANTDGAAPAARGPDSDGAHLLGFGTQVALDGRAAAHAALESRETVAGFIAALMDQVEADSGAHDGRSDREISRMLDPTQQATPGVSAVLKRGESAIMLHTFSDLGRVTMRLVSARSVPTDLVIAQFKETFSVGRSQSHVTSRFRSFPNEGERLERFLAGERAYARLRLDDPLAP